MSSYGKFLKDILSKKRRLDDTETVKLTEECSAAIQRQLPPKRKDPWSFSIPCTIGTIYFHRALCDLGSSINLMPLSIAKRIGLGEIKNTTISLQMADRSLTYPHGILEDVLVRVDKFILPADFIVLDMEEDVDTAIILSCPFLITGRTLIDVAKGSLILRVADQDVEFKVEAIDHVVQRQFEAEYPKDPLEASLVHEIEIVDEEPCMLEMVTLLEATPSYKQPFHQEFEPLSATATKPVPSIVAAPTLTLKPLPLHLKYAYLGTSQTLPVIINSDLLEEEEEKLLQVLKKHKTAIGWTIADIKGISPSTCMHRILLEENFKPTVENQRRLNPKMKEVVRAEVLKLLDAGIIYPISDSNWVSPVQVVPKKGGIMVAKNNNNDLIPTRIVTGWRVCIDYRKPNTVTRKDHFPLLFIDQMLERLAGHAYYCFLYGYSGYNQIPIAPEDQEKTTFTCPFGTFSYRMPFGLCNTPATFQPCMMSIFSDMVECFIEVFMDNFSVFGSSFDYCLSNLALVLQH
ncbi:hypothetical protein L3X38_026230 [Prunus dulcis]|uniref:Reverse transcriptase domain-containing protein n=2 Tax=Prunus dulcis TaxID=3755 RepID=A0AAD4Z849_PRUDU|nr:hypothetical protein L3X38_026230 [Prunus dulcis]